MLVVLVLLFCSGAFGLDCWTGTYNFRTSTSLSPITSALCPAGVCQLVVDTSSNVVQTASCVTPATCDANRALAFPNGNQYSAVACCTQEDNCNDPTRGISGPTTCADQTASTCPQNINCGWCFTTQLCTDGTAAGPLVGNCSIWDYPWSIVTPVSNGLRVYLRPGVPQNVTYTAPLTAWNSLNLLILLDNSLTSLFDADSLSNALSSISSSISQTYGKQVKFAVAKFHDLPVAPQSTLPQNYLFRKVAPFTSAVNVTQIALKSNFSDSFTEDSDANAAFSALMYGANGPEIDWEEGAFRVALVVTSLPSHVEGDGAVLGITRPNNYDGVLDAAPGEPAGTAEDYPALAGLREVLLSEGVYPLFAVSNPTHLAFYNDAQTQLGFGSVIDFSFGSGTTATLVNELTTILGETTQIVYGDTEADFVVDQTGGSYILYANTTNPNLGQDSVAVGIRNFGSPVPFTLFITTEPPIIGCDGVLRSGLVVDQCGECGGDNECLGCNGQRGSGAFDNCGVCGGDDSSCFGCDGILGSGIVFDICGVCDGDGTSCIGCDGVVNSGKNFSECGICGLEDPCAEGFSDLGIAGIILIILGVFLLCMTCMGVSWGKRKLSHERRNLKKDPLFVEAQQRHKLSRRGGHQPSGNIQASSIA